MNWYKIAQLNLENILNKWRNKGITLYVHETDNIIYLQSIIVPKEMRKQGIGSEIMKELINYADSIGKRIELTPALKDDYQGTTSKNRLRNWYKKFDFIQNKGRNKDFTTREEMYREPTKNL